MLEAYLFLCHLCEITQSENPSAWLLVLYRVFKVNAIA